MKTLRQFTKRSAPYLFLPILAGLIMLLQSCNSTSEQTSTAPPVYTHSLPTRTLSKPPSSTAISATRTPLPENKNQTSPPTNLDTIYVWGPVFYGYLLPDLDFTHNTVGVRPKNNQMDKYIVYLAFSPFSDEVAQLVENEDELLELWVANIDLSHARLLWTDTDNSFGYPSLNSSDQIFDISWGPGGKFVLISMNELGRSEPFQKNIVIDVQSQALWEIENQCNHYSIPKEKSNTISLFCKLISGEYLVLEADGTYRKTASLLGAQNIFMKQWSISPNSEHILYATEQDDIFVQSKSSSLKLHAKLGPTVDDLEPLQWSRNGNRLLIWDDGIGCWHGEQAPCWKVIDAQTGELLWAEDTFTYARATLSPDGKRLVRFMSGTFLDRYGAITDISTNSSMSITDTSFSKVVWIK